MDSDNWLSIHLFHQPAVTFHLLKKSVLPFIEQLHDEGQLNSFFFIRYADKGYHLRLRLRGDVEQLRLLSLPYFNQYFQANPTHQLSNFQEPPVQFIPYQPEIERFGGVEYIPIAEKHFYHSSNVILQLIAQSNNLTYDNAMSHALQLHLAFCSALRFSKTESHLFFKDYFKNWANTIYKIPIETLISKHFEPAFQATKSTLQPVILKLWEDFSRINEFETTWLTSWIYHCASLPLHYSKLSEAKKLAIYQSFLHLTNNRLGIHNEDEVYLSYLLYRLLEL